MEAHDTGPELTVEVSVRGLSVYTHHGVSEADQRLGMRDPAVLRDAGIDNRPRVQSLLLKLAARPEQRGVCGRSVEALTEC